jgi:hypothetical protein
VRKREKHRSYVRDIEERKEKGETERITGRYPRVVARIEKREKRKEKLSVLHRGPDGRRKD